MENIKVLISDIESIYRWAWAFAFACPVLFLIPVIVEFAQHIVEMQGGMYSSAAGAEAFADDPLRMQFGFVKVLALLLPSYWLTRFVLYGNDSAAAKRIEWPASGLWLVVFLFGAVQAFWGISGLSVSRLLNITDEVAANAVDATGSLLSLVIGIYLTAWIVAWAVGNAAIGPLQSIRIMYGSFWRTVALMLAGIMPLMALHYALGYAAIFKGSSALDWSLMLIDSVVTGFLALTLTGSSVAAARHAAEKQGLSLMPNLTLQKA